jgi:hypothetical protein
VRREAVHIIVGLLLAIALLYFASSEANTLQGRPSGMLISIFSLTLSWPRWP